MENIILHPDFNSSEIVPVGDLAIIKLSPRNDGGVIEWSSYSNPACLSPPDEDPEEKCEVAGWSVTNKGKGSLRCRIPVASF